MYHNCVANGSCCVRENGGYPAALQMHEFVSGCMWFHFVHLVRANAGKFSVIVRIYVGGPR